MSRFTRLAIIGAGLLLASLIACNDSTAPPEVPGTVEAGPDMIAGIGEYVTLDGTRSCAAGLTCTWRQLAGPDVTAGKGTLTGQLAGFTAPANVTSVQFELRVGNGDALSPPDTIMVLILADKYHAVFVSRTGWDTNPGTPEAPMRNIQKAIQRAAAAGNGADLYIAEGNYSGSLELASGVSLYGGYSNGSWLRDPATFPTVISGGRKAITGNQVADLTIDGLAIVSADGSDDGAEEDRSSIGVWLNGTRNIVISGNSIEAGNGVSGDEGLAGWPGRDGLAGTMGAPGSNDGTPPGSGGPGGLGLPNSGGRGGEGGWEGANWGATGAAGGGGVNAGAGGAGGAPGSTGGDGATGGSGKDGATGTPGGAGPGFGTIHPVFGYLAASGYSGQPGVPGGGGGGGGGGGAQSGAGVDDGSGNGGSGGGGGGASGLGGAGGFGGGGSFGIVMIDADSTIIRDNAITTGKGGKGGRGGAGGMGGKGGLGGASQNHEWDEIGEGGAGGNGGKGGDGGAGGGGGGGPSVGIVEAGADQAIRANNSILPGAAGTGGLSQAGADYNGEPGVQAEYYRFTATQSPVRSPGSSAQPSASLRVQPSP